MKTCQWCGSTRGVRLINDLFGPWPGLNLCDVCQSCERHVDKSPEPERLVAAGFSYQPLPLPEKLMHRLIPKLLD